MPSMIRSMILVAALSLAGCDRPSPSDEAAQAVAPASSPTAGREVAAATQQGPVRLSADLTRDGQPEDIVVEFLEVDIKKPFIWVLTIRTKDGEVIFSDRHDDQGLDEIVSDPEHVGECASYEECKRRYYFELLPRNLARCLDPAAELLLESDRTKERLKSAGYLELEEKSMEPAQIDAALSEMGDILSKPGFVSLCIPDGPDIVNPPMVWVGVIQKFVTYYRP